MPNLSCHALLELSCLICCLLPVMLLQSRHEFACPVIPRLSCQALPYLSCPFSHACLFMPTLSYLTSPVVPILSCLTCSVMPYLYCALPVLSCLTCSVMPSLFRPVLLYFGCPVKPSSHSVLSCLSRLDPILSCHILSVLSRPFQLSLTLISPFQLCDDCHVLTSVFRHGVIIILVMLTTAPRRNGRF